MKRCNSVTTAIALLCGTVLVSPLLQARTCSGNGDVLGAYGFTASRAGFFLLGATPPGSNGVLGSGPLVPVAVTPQGTTGTTTTNFSTTSIGTLVSGLSSTRVFSAVGRIFFDGIG